MLIIHHLYKNAYKIDHLTWMLFFYNKKKDFSAIEFPFYLGWPIFITVKA